MDVPREPPPGRAPPSLEPPARARRVMVLYNVPAERPVSGYSPDRLSEEGVVGCARAVTDTLRAQGHRVEVWPQNGHLAGLVARLEDDPPDVVFNLCEALDGHSSREALVPMCLEATGVSYTGSGPEALVLALSKARARDIFAARGIPVAPGAVVTSPDQIPWRRLPWPVVAKPACEDASLGILADGVFTDRAALCRRVVELVRRYRQPVLLERYLSGREFICGLVAAADGHEEPAALEPLPLSEVDYSGLPSDLPRILSYQAKWEEASPLYQRTPTVCPAAVDAALASRLTALAAEAGRALGVEGYARVDMRLDAEGRAHVLEVNPNPDLSPDAGLSRQGRAAGLSYRQLVERVLSSARRRS